MAGSLFLFFSLFLKLTIDQFGISLAGVEFRDFTGCRVDYPFDQIDDVIANPFQQMNYGNVVTAILNQFRMGMHLVNNFFMNLYVLLVDFQIHVGNGISGLLIGVDVGIKGPFQHMTHGFRHLSNSVFNI